MQFRARQKEYLDNIPFAGQGILSYLCSAGDRSGSETLKEEESLINGWNEIQPLTLANSTVDFPYLNTSGVSKRRIDPAAHFGLQELVLPAGYADYGSTKGTGKLVSQRVLFGRYPAIQPNDISHLEEKANTYIRPKNQKLTPGYEEPYANCGEVRFQVLCPTDPEHHKHTANYNCHRSSCSVCWPGWASRAAEVARVRIEGYMAAHNIARKPRHISLHPPPGMFDQDDPDVLQKLYDAGRDVIRDTGLKAAAVIPHPVRLRPDRKKVAEDLADASGINRYEWALSQQDWQDQVYFSPHLHLETYGPLMNSDEFEEKTGWTYRNHDGDGDSGRVGDELKKTLYYLLSHAWVNGNHKVVRYWLGMSTHSLKRVDDEPTFETMPCPKCKTDMVIIRVGDNYQDVRNAPVHIFAVRHCHFVIRVKRPRPARGVSQSAFNIWGAAGPPVLS